MIHTESIAYMDQGGKLTPLLSERGETMKFFISAPDLDSVRRLLQDETRTTVPVLFITRQTRQPQPSLDFQI
jgi:hypothetical protein